METHPLITKFIELTADHVAKGRTVRIMAGRTYSDIKPGKDVGKYLKGVGRELWLASGRKWVFIGSFKNEDTEMAQMYRLFKIEVFA